MKSTVGLLGHAKAIWAKLHSVKQAGMSCTRERKSKKRKEAEQVGSRLRREERKERERVGRLGQNRLEKE
jgi:hypothetical protein